MRNYLEIHTVDGDSVTVPGKLDEAGRQLEADFVRCHKSYLVNLKIYREIYCDAVYHDEREDNSDKPFQEKGFNGQVCAFKGALVK